MASLVKKTTLYAERNEKKRQKFLADLKALDPGELVYIDESGIDYSLCRNYARSKRGKQVKSDIYGKRSERTSLIAGWVHEARKIIAPYVFNGYTDAERFNGWVENCLVPSLKPGQTVIMDNASFHKGQKTRELIEKAHCKVLYLPPYSPDFNPIENVWAVIKSLYKTFKQRGYEHQNAIDAAFIVFL